MGNIRKKFENETKTRVNIIDFENSGKSQLKQLVIKNGVFEQTDFMNNDNHSSFPTEILCSSTRNNFINVYLSIKDIQNVVEELKDKIIKSVYEVCLICDNEKNDYRVEMNKEKDDELEMAFYNILNYQISNVILNKFYEVDNIQKIFQSINFIGLFEELKKMNYNNNLELLAEKDDYIWKTYFKEFKIEFEKQYYKWVKRISKYYADNEEGHEYINEERDNSNKYSNKDFIGLCEMLYGMNNSCALMIDRAYIKVPSSKTQFLGIVFIDYPIDAKLKNIPKIIENRIGEDYKELFMIVSKCSNELEYFGELKDNINAVTLNKRIFYVLNEFGLYKKQLFKNKNQTEYVKYEDNVIDTLKYNLSKKLGIPQERVVVTEKFKDINKSTLESLNTHNDFLQMLRLIRKQGDSVGKSIKITAINKEKIINISLNQERMIVQALMGMFYERYNGYLVDSWKKIIEIQNTKERNKYSNAEINTIIRNRKDNNKGYKYEIYSDNNQVNKRSVDFSLKSGDYNDSKRILKMLVDYGYQTVGFDPNENKILVNVNGDISQEDKDKLIKSIKGRLEENAIDYFESAFLMDISRKKFNTNSLYKALEIEKSITIDDFYTAFKEMFKKMSDNIVRYEVCLI